MEISNAEGMMVGLTVMPSNIARIVNAQYCFDAFCNSCTGVPFSV